MPDEVMSEHVRQFLSEAAQWISEVEPLPEEVTEVAQALQAQRDAVRTTLQQLAVAHGTDGSLARQQDPLTTLAASFAATRPPPVPTPQELREAETALRALFQLETPQRAGQAIEVEDAVIKARAVLCARSWSMTLSTR